MLQDKQWEGYSGVVKIINTGQVFDFSQKLLRKRSAIRAITAIALAEAATVTWLEVERPKSS